MDSSLLVRCSFISQ